MPESEETTETITSDDSPLVFISHDSRDAELAEAFSKLLKSASAGMLTSFRSSDRSGTEGIEFGDEWYKRLMTELDAATDVVCLLTERSLERPWILYEAGVAKGKMNTPVHGIALGVELNMASKGPFYQFQNCGDDEESLTKLVRQLCRRVPRLEPDEDVVKTQVQRFKKSMEEVTKDIAQPEKEEKAQQMELGAAAKILEEMKLVVREIPVLLEKRSAKTDQKFIRDRFLDIPASLFVNARHQISNNFAAVGSPDEFVDLIMIASIFRDSYPWLYVLGIEAFRAVISSDHEKALALLKTLVQTTKYTNSFIHYKEDTKNLEIYRRIIKRIQIFLINKVQAGNATPPPSIDEEDDDNN